MNRYETILASIPGATIGVIGDIVADVYILGHPDRLSREAPVMVVRFEEERMIPGCAANTMNNLLDLDCRVVPVSLMGDDRYGSELRAYFSGRSVPMDGIIERAGYRTVTKTRIMVGEPNRTKQQVIRIDCEPQEKAPIDIEDDVLNALENSDPLVDAWLVSDYGYSLFSARIAECLQRMTRNKPLVVDSRFRSLLFKGARCMTPNESEAIEASGVVPTCEADIENMGRELLGSTGADSMVITRGNQGMIIFEKTGEVARLGTMGKDEAVDVTGAGDTVVATMTAALVAGATTVEAATLASCAAGIVVMKTGAATSSRKELEERIRFIPEAP